nr:exodeoxyribonuclease III [Burkholderia glumae]
MLRVITANLNGIRSAAKKGFFDWLGDQQADCVCVQEIKVSADDLPAEFAAPHGFTGYFHHAQKKGYSGAGLYTRREPDDVIIGYGSSEFDAEGRYVEARFGKLSVVSVYVPSGSSGDERQQAKYRFMNEFMPHLAELKATREVIVCGDVNIVHKEIDIRNWKSNQKNSGCLPEERAWLTKLFDEVGYVDVFRTLDRAPTSTPGGATAARPTRRTWGGGSTTRSPRRAWRAPRSRPRSSATSSSATTHR